MRQAGQRLDQGTQTRWPRQAFCAARGGFWEFANI